MCVWERDLLFVRLGMLMKGCGATLHLHMQLPDLQRALAVLPVAELGGDSLGETFSPLCPVLGVLPHAGQLYDCPINLISLRERGGCELSFDPAKAVTALVAGMPKLVGEFFARLCSFCLLGAEQNEGSDVVVRGREVEVALPTLWGVTQNRMLCCECLQFAEDVLLGFIHQSPVTVRRTREGVCVSVQCES